MSRQLPVHPSDEDRIAAGMERELEAMTMTSPVLPGDGFADRVMAAIADEPLPQPVRAFGLALVGGHLRSAIAAVGDAWRTIASTPAPLAVRAQALALVLVVAVGSLALAGGAAVGAMGLLDRDDAPRPSQPAPSVAPSPSPSRSPSPSPSPEPTPSASPESTETPEATETPDDSTAAPTSRPRTATPTATGTDDHGGNSGSGSGSGSGSDHTPSPAGTDDHSGSDG
jgi:hypothetical protein